MENEIKVGEYVRLENGDIFKIDEDTTNYYNSNKDFLTNEIVKHSPNLTDIIEEGDYVNGEMVIKIFNPRFLSFGELPYIITSNYNNKYEPHEIEEIVTKEQFESVSYKVKE